MKPAIIALIVCSVLPCHGQLPSEQWRVPVDFHPVDYIVENNGNTLVVGADALVKLSTSGAEVWRKDFGTGMLESGGPRAAIDQHGNIYLLDNASLHKLDQDGIVVWTTVLPTWFGISHLVLDRFGNAFIYNTTSHLLRCDPTGRVTWTIDQENMGYDQARCDESGNCYVAFSTEDNLGVMKITPGGAIGYKRILPASHAGTENATISWENVATAIDCSGNAYFAGIRFIERVAVRALSRSFMRLTSWHVVLVSNNNIVSTTELKGKGKLKYKDPTGRSITENSNDFMGLTISSQNEVYCYGYLDNRKFIKGSITGSLVPTVAKLSPISARPVWKKVLPHKDLGKEYLSTVPRPDRAGNVYIPFTFSVNRPPENSWQDSVYYAKVDPLRGSILQTQNLSWQ